MRQIAIYGKGGIGKSTTTQNLAACLADKKRRILLLGCDPKADSTRLILSGKHQRTILDLLREEDPDDIAPEDLLKRGYGGITAGEAGGPDPGIGCAGRGIITAINLLEDLDVFEEQQDYVFYDVLGDVVCGGFAMPIREGKAKEIYIVCSGEIMALYAANNICRGVRRFAENGGVRLGGLILNERNTPGEQEVVSRFAERIGTRVIGNIRRDRVIQMAELHRQTVAEYAPDSRAGEDYRRLAEAVETNTLFVIPKPLKEDDFEAFAEEALRKYM